MDQGHLPIMNNNISSFDLVGRWQMLQLKSFGLYLNLEV